MKETPTAITLISEDDAQHMSFVVRKKGIEIIVTGAPEEQTCEACQGSGRVRIQPPVVSRQLAKNRTMSELIEASLVLGWKKR